MKKKNWHILNDSVLQDREYLWKGKGNFWSKYNLLSIIRLKNNV